MRPRAVIPIGLVAGFSLVFGCSYNWNVASEGDGGTGTSSSTSGIVGTSTSSSSSSSSSSGTIPPTPGRDAAGGPVNCGNECTCKENEKCDFGCVAKRTCKLTCEKGSDCKFLCPSNATCEVTCKDGAKCSWETQPNSEITSKCGDKPSACTGACALASECTNQCKKEQCNVACIGLPICDLHD